MNNGNQEPSPRQGMQGATGGGSGAYTTVREHSESGRDTAAPTQVGSQRPVTPCPACGATEGHQAVVYLGGVQRIVCGSCGATVKTFIRGTDFLLVGIVVAVILFWLIYRP